VVRGALTALRGATDADADLLVEWQADPEVSRYWDGETFTREEMLQRLRRPDVDAFIVEAGDQSVGYLQAWREGDAGGIDMFLIPDARGRGLGPDAAHAFARHLRDDRGWTRISVDPYTWNERAIRAWRKAGFVDAEERPPDDEHTSSWLLMVWDG
jgi:aminoglycoside 6'-N-acetyltransferase